MPIPRIVAICSSISEPSKTAAFLDYVTARFDGGAYDVTLLNLREFTPEAFFRYPVEDGAMTEAFAAIERADGIVFATPIYKASYSGLLKSFLDLLPQFAFAGKAILPLATGGSLAHVLALDYSLRPVVQSMGARHVVQSYFLPEKEMQLADGEVSLNAQAAQAVHEAIHHFKAAIASATDDRLLGHPRPERAAV